MNLLDVALTSVDGGGWGGWGGVLAAAQPMRACQDVATWWGREAPAGHTTLLLALFVIEIWMLLYIQMIQKKKLVP